MIYDIDAVKYCMEVWKYGGVEVKIFLFLRYTDIPLFRYVGLEYVVVFSRVFVPNYFIWL